MTEPGDDGPTLIRPDEDDQDLLSYGEAAVRLQEEVTGVRRRIVELESAGADAADGTPMSDELAALRSRLSALIEAVDRHGRQRINDENFEKFFGYNGRARRRTN